MDSNGPIAWDVNSAPASEPPSNYEAIESYDQPPHPAPPPPKPPAPRGAGYKLMLLIWKESSSPPRRHEGENNHQMDFDSDTYSNRFDKTYLGSSWRCKRSSNISRCIIGWAPEKEGSGNEVDEITRVVNKLETIISPDIEWESFTSEKRIEDNVAQSSLKDIKDKGLKAGVIFGRGLSSIRNRGEGTYPYKIRMMAIRGSGSKVYEFQKEDFLVLQLRTEQALIKSLTGKSPTGNIHLYNTDNMKNEAQQRSGPIRRSSKITPYASTSRSPPSPMVEFKTVSLAQSLIFGFLFMVPSIVGRVVGERVTGVKELMKLSGVPNWEHWLAWILNSMVPLTLSVVGVAMIVTCVGSRRMFWGCNVVLLIILLEAFVLATTTFCFFISTFFTKPSLGTCVGLLIYFVTDAATVVLGFGAYAKLTFLGNFFVCLSPNFGLVMGCMMIGRFENGETGITWGDLFEPATPKDTMTLGYVILALLTAAVLYLVLAMYLENIMPTEYGVRRPWHYPVSDLYQMCQKKSTKVTSGVVESDQDSLEKPGFEKEPETLKAGVVISNLKKSFGRKNAVDGVSMTMYEGEIFALLGHNGAGKTTTISCCTGVMSPTSGSVVINGVDIVKNPKAIGSQVCLCPQHNLLFDDLTVDQHLAFFGRLKGMSSSAAKIERGQMLNRLRLTDKANSYSKKLSGGQKRKLCLGIALIGDAKVVFLDEPTSGLDVEARRAIWDALLAERGNRTIILTTHFMEEADVLGDRIAIMAQGKVQCSGSSMFLKKYFGAGYTFHFTMTGNNGNNGDSILAVVQGHVPTATLEKGKNAGELSITLPTEDCPTSLFPKIFKSLQDKQQSLGIISMGMSLTTMDDVYIKVDEASSAGNKSDPTPAPSVAVTPAPSESHSVGVGSTSQSIAPAGSEDTVAEVPEVDPEDLNKDIVKSRNRGVTLWCQQFGAFVCKRFSYIRRKWKSTTTQVVLPVLIFISCILGANRVMYETMKTDAPSAQKIGFEPYSDKIITLYNDINEVTLNEATWSHIIGPSARQAEGPTLQTKYIFALELNETEITAFYQTGVETKFNNEDALALSLASNVLLAITMDRRSNVTPHLEMTTHPFSRLRNLGEMEKLMKEENFGLIQAALCGGAFPFGLAILATMFIIPLLEEKICNAKQLQLMTGASPLIYWGTCFVCDFAMAFATTCVIFICIFCVQDKPIYTDRGILFLILIVSVFASISLAHLFSLAFNNVTVGFAVVLIIQLMSGVIGSLASSNEGVEGYTTMVAVMRGLFMWFPSFGTTLSVIKFLTVAMSDHRCAYFPSEGESLICVPGMGEDWKDYERLIAHCCQDCSIFPEAKCLHEVESSYLVWTMTKTMKTTMMKQVTPRPTHKPWTWPKNRPTTRPRPWPKYFPHPSFAEEEEVRVVEIFRAGLGQELFYILLVGVLYQIILLLLEVVIFPLLKKHTGKGGAPQVDQGQVDPDVQEEADRVKELVQTRATDQDALVVENFAKMYGPFAAVADVSFGVHHGECFGLLGVNGAGKTTTFRMLTGDESRTRGNAYISNTSLTQSGSAFYSRIGYCPQSDGIIGVLSGLEMVLLFARLRGVKQVKNDCAEWMERVGLTDSKDVQCRNYSGGMKRRLSAAMALVGDPDIVLLDEPTSGVDPVSRREFWKIIMSTKASGRAIILTSHSMDEIEACCSRLGIMVNGRLQCLGGVQYLKSKFAQGFTLSVTLTQEALTLNQEVEELIFEILQKFDPCMLRDRHATSLQYQVLNPTIPWDVLFGKMEEVKVKYEKLIADYSITETTLEEVFLAFARMQYPSRYADTKCPCKCG
ncbi:ATP-binding cassette sub-family A member 3 [Folsomia candida]|uniref:ATP-binding cassette sub-family A member 3 n=1 Tax=Folsomia candida TaxID=158441 RepID=UPI000B90967C|nr:ATP-binding cassette sub-family A member 3 [Folsomia candida]